MGYLKRSKKIIAGSLVISIMLGLSNVVQIINAQDIGNNQINMSETKNNEKVYIKIRYNRPDNKYDGWNLWVWEEGSEGRRVDFIGEDSKGKFAVVETSKESSKLGFILRKSSDSNHWEENYFKEDKFIDLKGEDKEVIINHVDEGNKTLDEAPLNKKYEKVQLNLHYYRFDDNYENWDIWSWPKDGDGKGYVFNEEDDYGKIAKIDYKIGDYGYKEDTDSIGFLVRKSDWSDRDIGFDRFINTAYANEEGILNAYIVQGDENIYFDKDKAIKTPAIMYAKIDTLNEISFKVNSKLSKDAKVILKQGDKVINSNISINDDFLSGKITTDEELDITKTYSLNIDGYTSKESSLGKIYSDEAFEKLYHYNGKLGAIYSKKETEFVLWSPTAKEVKLALYGKDGNDYKGKAKEVVSMKKGKNGTWTLNKKGDLNGEYYNYIVNIDGKENEVTDPYAKAVGVNGNRAMVIDLDKTNPSGWNKDKSPKIKNTTDNIIYEMHIRDFSISDNSGITYKGKYNGVWQPNTTIPGTDVKTGVEHLKELGVTTVHLLPTFDHKSIDETKLDTPQYNWGYDPQNYNVPEGSYSSNPYEAQIRIKEFKEMVQELHKSGIRVVMDVVYNHTGKTEDSHLNLAVPGYYYRQNENGVFSNGSGCGNEVASERSMVRKMIIESVAYWAKEYHIDGFRFDLMGLHDIDTMKEIREELDDIDKSILMYGEGWNGGASPLKEEDAALKKNTYKYEDKQIAAFSDDIRDAIKGSVFNEEDPGFINGKNGLEESIKFGVVASTKHKEVDYNNVNYSDRPWANEPYQTVTYTSAHDNLTLYDKLQKTNKSATKEELIQINKMASAIILTSQGIPFIHAGDEFARTKVNEDGSLNENSYNAPDSVNQFDWQRKVEYKELFEYYKGLINLRKNHNAFTMDTNKDIQNNIDFLEKGKDFKEDNVVAYTINGKKVKDKWDNITVIFNANKKDVEVKLPSNDWVVVVNEDKAGVKKLDTVKGNKVNVPANASYVLVDAKSFNKNK